MQQTPIVISPRDFERPASFFCSGVSSSSKESRVVEFYQIAVELKLNSCTAGEVNSVVKAFKSSACNSYHDDAKR